MGVIEQVQELLQQEIREEGKKEGRKEALLAAADRMLRDGIHIQLVSKYTGISIPALNKLVKNI